MKAYDIVSQLSKMLGNLGGWLDKAEEYADTKKFDAGVLLQSRLAPDQFPLIRQVQTVCDNAKFAAARLTGSEAPKHADDEATFEQLRARIKGVRDYLATFTEDRFVDCEARRIVLPFMPGKSFSGSEYAIEFLLPNFYFHAIHAYAILRHNGVPLGKQEYIGSLPLVDD